MFNWESIFSDFPPEIATLLISMIPIGELRGALPVALEVFHLPLWSAYFFAVIGNLIPVIFVLWLLEPVYKFATRHSILLTRFFDWIFAGTRRRLQKKVDKYGWWALMLFVMIPLPVTGAWTGSFAAFVFGIEYKRALLAITCGVLIAGVIVSVLTLGVGSLFSL